MTEQASMSLEQAIKINGRLTEAYLVRSGLRKGAVPLFLGISLDDAKQAAQSFSNQLTTSHGRNQISMSPASDFIQGLYTWAILQRQMTYG